ncbi:MBL fold metallo-hydrolase [Streptomyces sp. 900105245]
MEARPLVRRQPHAPRAGHPEPVRGGTAGPDRGDRVAHHIHETSAYSIGHTPGSSVLRVASRGERAVFVGDLLHSPVQILRPECSSCFCLDPRQAAATRRRELERAAEERALVVPAHFAGAGAVEVRKARDGFTLHRWAA